MKKELPSKQAIEKELDELEDVLAKDNPPVVFCHGNLVRRPSAVVSKYRDTFNSLIHYIPRGIKYQSLDVTNETGQFQFSTIETTEKVKGHCTTEGRAGEGEKREECTQNL